MAKQVINIGAAANDGTGDALRTAFDKSNANFTELYDFDTALPAAAQTLTNKTIIDYSNTVHADLIHYRIKCVDAGGVVAGAPLAFSGFNAGENAIEVVRANQATGVAIGVALEALANGAFGLMVIAGVLEGIATDAYPKAGGTANEGDILYVDGLGLLTGDEPTTGFAQPIALLVRKSATVGAIQVLAAYPKQDAADVRFTPAGDIAATNVQAALQELDAEKATAAQGALADSALQPTDIDTLAELNALLTDATLIDTNDSRLSDARTPLAHTHTHADITDYDTEIAGKTNTTAYTPTADYHPATKKYVDDAIVSGGGYTDAQAQDAVGAILTDTAEIDFTYDAVAPKTITASLKTASIDETKLDASVNASLDLADSALQPSAIGVSVQAHSAILDATTASFTTADETKLDGIEAGADVTDATNVAAAGAIMDGDFTANGIMKRTGAGTYATAVEDTDYQGVLAEGAFVDGDKTKLDGIAAGAEVNTIDSVTSGEPTGSDVVLNVVSLTQAEYDAGTPVATTLYIIT